jgi:hypothetical protein
MVRHGIPLRLTHEVGWGGPGPPDELLEGALVVGFEPRRHARSVPDPARDARYAALGRIAVMELHNELRVGEEHVVLVASVPGLHTQDVAIPGT